MYRSSYCEDNMVKNRLISTIGIPVPVRVHLYIASELRSRYYTRAEINFMIWIFSNLVVGNVRFIYHIIYIISSSLLKTMIKQNTM